MSEDSRIEIDKQKEQRNKRGIIVLICLFVGVCLLSLCVCYFSMNLSLLYQYSLSNFTDEGKAAKALIEEAENWEVKFFDNFEEDNQLWWVGTDSSKYGIFEQTIEDGAYRIDATAKQGFYRRETFDIRPISDFYLSVEVDKTSGSYNGEYGVVFRKKAPNFYNFTINDSGTFVVRIMYKGEWDQLMVGNYFPRGGQDKPRKITVIAKGSDFYFYVDDQFVTHVDDDRLRSGFVGVTFGLDYDGEQAVFEFDNFELRVPGE
ncbi:MAG: hypothetical protein PVF83_08540 [Anaerolineales bacterium]